jgi:hypothetical protein
VNRLFNDTCTHFLYEELNIFDQENELDYEVASRYGKHVKILRVRLFVNVPEPNEAKLIKLITLCINIHSIGIYHLESGKDQSFSAQTPLGTQILSAIRDRALRSIGFYCPSSYNALGREIKGYDQHLFYEIATSNQAKLIKRLDVFFGGTNNEQYALIRTRFTGLEALTIRMSFNRDNGPIWNEGNKGLFWGPYSNLINLQFVGCFNVYIPHIPELIRHFPSLEYFLISACGHGPPEPHGRKEGWSAQSDGWWNRRNPIKLIHLEYLERWEMLAMGTIPALEVRAVSLEAGDLAYAFMEDHEVFPHLQLLRAEPLESNAFRHDERRERERVSEIDLRPVLGARNIEFKRDASCVVHSRYDW